MHEAIERVIDRDPDDRGGSKGDLSVARSLPSGCRGRSRFPLPLATAFKVARTARFHALKVPTWQPQDKRRQK